MKKMLFLALCIATATTILLVACKKTATTEATTTCTDSAFLMPDSMLACSPAMSSGYKMFYIRATQKDILVAKGTFTDIDTVVNGGNYLINFDSTGTVPMCGAVVTKANLTCHTKL
jgi:hypothetical protein